MWSDICGWYGPVTNLFTRAAFGAGLQARVRRGDLLLQPMTPLPPMRSGFPLHPDEPEDPHVFRVAARSRAQPRPWDGGPDRIGTLDVVARVSPDDNEYDRNLRPLEHRCLPPALSRHPWQD